MEKTNEVSKKTEHAELMGVKKSDWGGPPSHGGVDNYQMFDTIPTMTTKNEPEVTPVVVMKREKDCKGVVKFSVVDPKDPTVALTNAYISRNMKGINKAKSIKITVEVVE